MACRGLVDLAFKAPLRLPCRASRKTIVSPRSFQVLARESGQRLSSSTSLPTSHRARIFPRLPPCQAYHGSSRARAPETKEPNQSHGQHVSRASTTEKGMKKKEQTDNSILTSGPPLIGKVSHHSLSEQVRRFMSRVPQPVTIVTSSNTQTHPTGNPLSWHGATISSFNTVTLAPDPFISFNLRHDSSTFAAIVASGKLWVHFLSATTSARKLADRFTKRDVKVPFQMRRDDARRDKVNNADNPLSELPQFHDVNERVAFTFECAYLEDKTVRLGDHVVLFASVARVIEARSSNGTRFKTQRPCLVYVDGKYLDVRPLEESGNEQEVEAAWCATAESEYMGM